MRTETKRAPWSPAGLSPAAPEIIRGAGAIAEFLFGDPGKRKAIYRLVENSRLPVFRLGGSICARRSALLAFIEQQEKRAAKE